MARLSKRYGTESGLSFGPDSIVFHLRHAFERNDEEMAFSLSQHAADHIEALCEAIAGMVEAYGQVDPTVAQEDAVKAALVAGARAMEGPAWTEDNWPGASELSADLDKIYGACQDKDRPT